MEKLIESKRRNRPEYPCPVCNEWQDIDCLLRNAPAAARPVSVDELLAEVRASTRVAVQKVEPVQDDFRARLRQGLVDCFSEEQLHTLCFDMGLDYERLPAKGKDNKAREIVAYFERTGSIPRLVAECRRLRPNGPWDEAPERLPRNILSRIDEKVAQFLQAFTDEAKEGPRLFSLAPVDHGLNPRAWVHARFRLTLWCEHSHLPLAVLNAGGDRSQGVYEIELDREWFWQAAPFLKVAAGTLSLVLPLAWWAARPALDDAAYKAIEEQLDFGKSVIDAVIGEGARVEDWLGTSASGRPERDEAIRGQGATLREIQTLLKARDPGFGGLVRVMNKRQEFLWVHPSFEKEY